MKYIILLALFCIVIFALLGIRDFVQPNWGPQTYHCDISSIANEFPGDLNFTRISCIAKDGSKQNFIVQN